MQLEQYAAWGSCPRTLWQTGEARGWTPTISDWQTTDSTSRGTQALSKQCRSLTIPGRCFYILKKKNMFRNIALFSSQSHSVRWWVWCLHEQQIRTVEKLVNGKTKWWHQMEMSEGWAKISILFNIYNVEETNNNTWLKVYIFNSDSLKYTSRSQYA